MIANRVLVFGPAYLDRVLKVDQPLIDPVLGPPLDQSVDGVWKFGTGPWLELTDPAGYAIGVELPVNWPGPTGEIHLASPMRQGVIGRAQYAGWRGTMTWEVWELATRRHSVASFAVRSDQSPIRQVEKSHRGWPSWVSPTIQFAFSITARTGPCSSRAAGLATSCRSAFVDATRLWSRIL